jgi:hypothetical protein
MAYIKLRAQCQSIFLRRALYLGLCVLSALLLHPLHLRAQAQTDTTRQPVDTKILALPELTQPVILRVVVAENPRFEALTPANVDAVLAHAQQAVKLNFNIDIRFDPAARMPLAGLFAAIPAKTRANAEKSRMGVIDDAPTQEQSARSLLKDMRIDGDFWAQRRFATPDLLEAPADDSQMAFARALIATQHRLLAGWRDKPARDGLPSLGADRFNEYTYWVALGDTDLPYDVILTNQLIASAEREDNSVHSALRGGVSNGITSQSRAGRFQLRSVVSSFPFVDNSAQTQRLRGGVMSTPADANLQMGLMLAHELGHLLLHLGHPFANPACVMTPPVRLEFRKWQQGLDAHTCPLADSKANTPGFIKFTRPEILFK